MRRMQQQSSHDIRIRRPTEGHKPFTSHHHMVPAIRWPPKNQRPTPEAGNFHKSDHVYVTTPKYTPNSTHGQIIYCNLRNYKNNIIKNTRKLQKLQKNYKKHIIKYSTFCIYSLKKNGTPDEIRTHDLLLRRQRLISTKST